MGSLRGRRIPALMLAGGGAATAALIAWAGYPASMVGVNGAHISNLNPPTLAVVTFGIAQCGLALLLRDRLTRLMRRPLAWAGLALVNLSAMTLFIRHQTAFVTVSSVGLLAGRVPGLSGLCLVFRRAERALRPRISLFIRLNGRCRLSGSMPSWPAARPVRRLLPAQPGSPPRCRGRLPRLVVRGGASTCGPR